MIFFMVLLRHEARWTVRRGAGYDAWRTLPAGLGRDRRQPPGGRTGGLVEQLPVDPLVAGGEHGDVVATVDPSSE
jgi:hypothetical protein